MPFKEPGDVLGSPKRKGGRGSGAAGIADDPEHGCWGFPDHADFGRETFHVLRAHLRLARLELQGPYGNWGGRRDRLREKMGGIRRCRPG
jgi:hypothetical protein